MKRLSVCMIVKDEEKVLPRCLDSVRAIADEIIIVDTGSSDNTKQIAKQYTDKVLDYVWSNDFSAARNESIRYATGKWVLVLDADEYLAEEDADKWVDFLECEQPSAHLAYTLPVINFTGDVESDDEFTTAPVTRLFPNHQGIYFERPIHEQLTRGKAGELYNKKLTLPIYHTGYQTHCIEEKNKHERNMTIFNEMKSNQQMSSYDWFTLGNQYRYGQEEENALHCYEKAMQGSSEELVWFPHCMVHLITLYYKLDYIEKSWELTEKYLSKYQKYAEYHAIKGVHYVTLGFFDQAITCFHNALEVAESRAESKQEVWLVDPMYSFDVPVRQLIDTYFLIGDSQKAIYWLTKLLSKNKMNINVLYQLLEWLCYNDNIDSIKSFLDCSYNQENRSDMILLLKVSLGLGQLELVDNYLPCLDSVEQLSLSEQLRLAIMRGDHSKWSSLVQLCRKMESVTDQTWLHILLGMLVWKDLAPSRELVIDDSKFKPLVEIISSIIKGKAQLSSQELNQNATELFLISKQLFLLKQYDIFDEFVQLVECSEITNNLANYFYSVNLTDTAMNYYSVLLSRNELNAKSLENLGVYHAIRQYHEEAVEFLSASLELQPKARHLYYLLITYATKADKSSYIDWFIKQFPTYKEISFVKEFIYALY